MSDEEQEIFYREGAKFLSPANVGSSLHWYVRVHSYIIGHGKKKGQRASTYQGCLNLTDCDRRISWSLDDVEKIDNAIAEFQKIRRAIIAGRKHHEAYKAVDDDGMEL